MLIADASSSKNAALFLRQIRLDTFAPGARDLLADAAARPDAAGLLPCRRLRTRFRPRQTRPRDLPDRRARTRRRAPPRDRDRGRHRRNPGRQSRRYGRDRRRTSRRRRPARRSRRRSRGHHTRRHRHHRPVRRKAGHAKGITPTTTASRRYRATSGGCRGRLRPRQRAQIDLFGAVSKVMRTAYHNVPNGGSRAIAGASKIT